MAGAALAFSLATSQAQVYSANIVGYVQYTSQTVSPNFEMIANPLDNGTNTVISVFPTAPGGTTLQFWQPVSGTFLSAKFSAGHWKEGSTVVDNTLIIPPGIGFFISVGGTGIYTNTFVGNVDPATGTQGTNVVNTGFQALSSILPISDNVTNTATVNLIVPGGTKIQRWNPTTQTFGSVTFTGGKWKVGSTVTNVVLNLPEGFFLQNNSGSPFNWTQTGP